MKMTFLFMAIPILEKQSQPDASAREFSVVVPSLTRRVLMFWARLLWFTCGVAALVLNASASTGHGQLSMPDEGFTEPFKTVLVASPESGVIKQIEVNEGDSVRHGDVICRLDNDVLQVALLAAQVKVESRGKLEAAEVTLENKRHHLAQMKRLLDKAHASDQEVKLAQLEFDLAKASVQSASDELRSHAVEVDKIKAQIARRVVLAPNDGVILQLPHQAGESVTPTESHVATIVQLNQLRVRYFLTTQQAAAMKKGGIARVQLPATGQRTNAKVAFIAPVTDSNSGTVRVELLIDNAMGKFRSGLRCILEEAETATATDQFNRFIQFK